MKVGLFFGSFNPIHIGHLILANYILEYSEMDELWFVVSPQNPFKEKKTLLDDHIRLEMVNLAIEDYDNIKVSDIEFGLPQPNYTIDTLTYLHEKFPQHNFCLIMGEDNLYGLHKWKNAQRLIDTHQIIVYPRINNEKKCEFAFEQHENILRIDAPIIEISATQIREMIKNHKNVKPMLPPSVFDYLDGSSFYQ